jgi:signal peptidase I
MSVPPNDEMQRTTPGQNGASPLISVFGGHLTVRHAIDRIFQLTLMGSCLTLLSACGTPTTAIRVPGGGMEPNINPGDTIEVRHNAYRSASDVHRSDVVVLAIPGEQPERLAVKRVLGLPGERVSIAKGRVSVNGANLSLRPQHGSVFLEEAPPRSYLVTLSGACSESLEATVPEGHFYVIGDNRCASLDSRVFGAIPFSAIRGREVGSEE